MVCALKRSLIAVPLLVALSLPPTVAADSTTCAAIAPLALRCKAEVVLLAGDGSFDDHLANLVGFGTLAIAFHPKLLNAPGQYDAVPAFSCVTAVPGGCDGQYLDTAVGPYQSGVYKLVADVTGTLGGSLAAGEWGWGWQA